MTPKIVFGNIQAKSRVKLDAPFPIPPAVTDDTAPRDIRCGAKRAPREPKATVAQVIAIIRAAHAEATA